MISKKIKISILILVVAGGTVLFYWKDLAGFFSGFSPELPKIQESVGSLVQQTEKQILTPIPLQSDSQIKGAALTREGVIEQTNIQREKYGLPPLKENLKLDASAEAKAKDMFKNQYFSHISPSGVGVSDLAGNEGYDFIVIGENLALGDFASDSDLVQAWMNSEGHRENILNKDYRDIGVAVEMGEYQGRITWMAVQHFGEPLSACPQPDTSLKYQIDSNKTLIDKLQAEIENMQAELESEKNYQEVKKYNSAVSRYNGLISQTKEMVSEYNAEVDTFNSCAAGA